MSENPIRSLLARLSAPPARRGFTDRVLARLDQPPPSTFSPAARLALAGALAVMVACGTFILHQRSRAAEQSQQAERLRNEHKRLRTELEAIRAAAEPPPLVYIPGEDYDLVVERGVGLAANVSY